MPAARTRARDRCAPRAAARRARRRARPTIPITSTSTYAAAGVSTANGITGARARLTSAPTTHAASASARPCTAIPPNSVPFDVPIAFSTAMSRERSSAVRYTIVATMPAAISHSSVLKIATVCVPDFCGRFRSLRTSRVGHDLRTGRRRSSGRRAPRSRSRTAGPRGSSPARRRPARNTVGCPK